MCITYYLCYSPILRPFVQLLLIRGVIIFSFLQFTLGQAHLDLEQNNSQHKMKIELSSIFQFVFTLGQAHVNLVKKNLNDTYMLSKAQPTHVKI